MAVLTIPTQDLKETVLFVVASFVIAILVAPILTNFLYKNRLGKRLRQHGADGKAAPIFSKLHESKAGTPVMGGLLFWVTTAVLTALFHLDRGQTWLPIFALVSAGIIGGVDDIMNVMGKGSNGGGLRLKHKFWVYAAVAAVGAWWFYSKLGFSSVGIPGIGNFDIGLWYIPLFIGTVIFVAFSMNQTDGLDGLAGGVSLLAFFVFLFIALVQGKVHLAVFCATMLGSLLAFLWFNIHPARFFMGDTGSMALGMTLPILAFLTNSVVLLPFILLIPLLEGLSTVIQITSKRLFKRKVFLVAPIHHHFEAIGWPEARVTMRFWVIAAVGCAAGLMLALVQ
ncbi:MAG TPA: phospho-N-acetylmuramoyl-pentapeptide-transferase [Verrucomicrobiae bacterium]|nr:phospho-N-acetylmuramoyl-pentapeptide-transferase [Verrucomicrobiae bacterium]